MQNTEAMWRDIQHMVDGFQAYALRRDTKCPHAAGTPEAALWEDGNRAAFSAIRDYGLPPENEHNKTQNPGEQDHGNTQ